MKLSPQTELAEARRELELAREACPHWDYGSDNDGWPCCDRVFNAKVLVLRAKKKVTRNA